MACGAIPASPLQGFPRVFYLKYHGYSGYFPLWALAAFRTLTSPRNHALSAAGVVAALAAEARTLGARGDVADGLFEVDGGMLVAVSGDGLSRRRPRAARRL